MREEPRSASAPRPPMSCSAGVAAAGTAAFPVGQRRAASRAEGDTPPPSSGFPDRSRASSRCRTLPAARRARIAAVGQRPQNHWDLPLAVLRNRLRARLKWNSDNNRANRDPFSVHHYIVDRPVRAWPSCASGSGSYDRTYTSVPFGAVASEDVECGAKSRSRCTIPSSDERRQG
jgi:hypothetical protein